MSRTITAFLLIALSSFLPLELVMATAAPTATRHVAPTGSDTTDCANSITPCATIQYAHDQATAGDTILIAAGVYTGAISLNRSITLQGEDAATTIIDGNQAGHAINQAFNSGETVHIEAGVYSETLTIAKHITLQGVDSATTIIAGDGTARVIAMSYTPFYDVAIRHLTIRNGQGGILSSGGSLRVENSRITGNNATGAFLDEGGGIYSWGVAVISNTAVYSNSGQYGGGIYARGATTITHSAIYSNTATESGGGVYIGINDGENRAALHNSTISGNVAATAGGLDVASAGTALSLRHVTIAHNQTAVGSNTPGGLSLGLGVTANLANSIIAQNGGSTQCAGMVNLSSLGGNVVSDGSCGATAASDQANTNPLLGLLRHNGGPTWTHALLGGSKAINAGETAHCLPTDQRGTPRPFGPVCDSGAYEADGSEPAGGFRIFLPLTTR